jgi:hypothetical protein
MFAFQLAIASHLQFNIGQGVFKTSNIITTVDVETE